MVEERPTEVAESNRQAKISRHLGAAIGPDLVMGAQIGKVAKVGNVTVEGQLLQNIRMNAIMGILMNSDSKLGKVIHQKCEINE